MNPLVLPEEFFSSSNKEITWLTDGTNHFLLLRFPDATWLQFFIREPKVIVNRVEATDREWRDHIHQKYNGWEVRSCHVEGVHVYNNRIDPDWEILEDETKGMETITLSEHLALVSDRMRHRSRNRNGTNT